MNCCKGSSVYIKWTENLLHTIVSISLIVVLLINFVILIPVTNSLLVIRPTPTIQGNIL